MVTRVSLIVRWAVLVLAATFAFAAPAVAQRAPAQQPSGTITAVQISGNVRAETETIRSYLQLKEGQPYDAAAADRSLKALFSTGLFSDVVIDMQVLFDSHPDWGVADLRRILPQVLRLAKVRPEHTVCTRFVPPVRPKDAAAGWQRYYHYWRNATLDRAGTGAIELVGELAALPIAGLVDKSGYSAHSSPDFAPLLQQRGVKTLILSGVETDVCVWATALDAVDAGFFVVLARDAMTSFSVEAHAATLDVIAPRFAPQLFVMDSATLDAAWK